MRNFKGRPALVLGLAAWTFGGGFGAARAQTSSDSFSSPWWQHRMPRQYRPMLNTTTTGF